MATNSDLLIRIAAHDEASNSIRTLQSSIIRLVGAVASLVTAFKAISFPLQESIAFEKSMKNVQKTTDFTDESIQALGTDLRKLATETGIAATSLGDIAAQAGQLGLARAGRQAILDFTDTIARFAVVADLSVEQAATSIAKITNIFQIPIDQAERVSSAFNELSNTTVATADQLVDVVARVGDAGGLVDFQQALALAGQALELGQSPEVAGTAITKTLANMQTDAEKFAKVLNITTDEWTDKLNTNALGALKEVASVIADLGQLQAGALTKSLFGSGRQFSFGAKLVRDAANDFTILNRTLADAQSSFEKATSAQDEYNRVSDSSSRAVDILKVKVQEIALQFGDVLLPVFRDVVEKLQEFASDELVQARFVALAEVVRDAAIAFTDWLTELASNEDAFNSFFNAVKLLVGLGLASFFLSITTGVIKLGGKLILLGRLTKVAATSFAGLKTVMEGVVRGDGVSKIAQAAGLGTIKGQVAQAAVATKNYQSTVQVAAGAIQGAVTATQTVWQKSNAAFQTMITGQSAAMTQYANLVAQKNALIAASAAKAAAGQAKLGRTIAVQTAAAQRVTNAAFQQGTLASKVAQTQLTAINTQLVATRAAAFGAAGAISRISTVAAGLGTRLLGFVTNPFVSLALVFGPMLYDSVKGFFGFFKEESSTAGAQATADAQKLRKEYERLNSVFIEVMKNKPKLEQPVPDAANIAEFDQAMGRVTSNVIQYTEAARGANQRTTEFATGIVNARRRLEELQKQRAALVDKFNVAQAGAFPGTTSDEADAVMVDVRATTAEIEHQTNAVHELEAAHESAQTLAQEQGIEAVRAAAIQAQYLDQNVINLIKAQREVNTLTQNIELQGKALEQNDKDLFKSKTTAEKQALLLLRGQIEESLKNNKVLMARAQAIVEPFLNENGVIGKNLAPGVDETVRRLTDLTLNATTFKSIIESVESGPVGAVGDNVERVQKQLHEAIIAQILYGKQSKIFEEAAKRIGSTSNAIKGLFDNLDTTTRKLREDTNELTRSLSQIPTNRKIKLEIERDRKFSFMGEKWIDKEISDIKRRLENEIAGIDLSTFSGRDRADTLTQWADERTRLLEQQKEQNAAEAEAADLERNRSEVLNELNLRMEIAAGIQDQLKKLEEELLVKKKAGEVVTEAELQQRQMLLEKAAQYQNLVREGFDTFNAATEKLAEFSGTKIANPFDPEELQTLQSVVSDSRIGELGAESRRVGDQVASSIAGVTRQAQKSAESTTAIVTDMAQFQGLAGQAAENAKLFADSLGISKDSLTALIAEATTLVDTLGPQSLQAAEFIKLLTERSPADAVLLPQNTVAQVQSDIASVTRSFNDMIDTRNRAIEGVTALSQLPEDIAKQIEDQTNIDPLELAINTEKLVTDAQKAFGSTTFTAEMQLQVTAKLQELFGGPKGAFASGGHVRGAGTGTSDSILARLSNGEYVMDALTTRKFGAGFFRKLQNAARSGGRFALPGFAAGGIVGPNLPSLLAAAGGGGPSGTVNLNLAFGGESFALQGDREQVQRLTKALKNVSRGRGK